MDSQKPIPSFKIIRKELRTADSQIFKVQIKQQKAHLQVTNSKPLFRSKIWRDGVSGSKILTKSLDFKYKKHCNR